MMDMTWRSGLNGMYYGHTSVAYLDFTLSEVREGQTRYADPLGTQHAGRFTWRLRRPTDSPKLSDLLPILTRSHERQHYLQFMSMPCGLLLWRSLQAIVSTAGYLLQKIKESGADATITSFPLAQWYEFTGRRAIQLNPQIGDSTRRYLKARGIDAQSYFPRVLDKYFEEFRVLADFWYAFNGRSNLDMQAFVKLANEAFETLALNSDIQNYPNWSAHDLSLDHYLPKQGFTLNEIAEADARLLEHQHLDFLGVTSEEFGNWRKRFIVGGYRRAYDWLLTEIVDKYVARVALEIAMTSPVDLRCTEAVQEGVIYVEDCLPSWRLVKIVEALKHSFWPHERDLQLQACESLAQQARIPTPAQALSALTGISFTGENAWGTDAKLRGIPEEDTPMAYFRYCEEELKRGLQIRKDDFLAFLRPEVGEIFQPMLEFYKDTALLNGSPVAPPSLPLYVKAYQNLIANLTILEIFLGEGNLSDLPKLERGFRARMCDIISLEEEEELSGASVKDIVQYLVGPHVFPLLTW